MMRRILSTVVLVMLLGILVLAPMTAGAEVPPVSKPASFLIQTEQGAQADTWVVTYSLVFREDVRITNGGFKIRYDTDALKAEGKAERLEFFKTCMVEVNEREAGLLHFAFLKMPDHIEPGTYPIVTVTYQQSGKKAGTTWFEDIKIVEDLGEGKSLDYAKTKGDVQAPGWDGVSAYTIGNSEAEQAKSWWQQWWVWAGWGGMVMIGGVTVFLVRRWRKKARKTAAE